MKVTPIPCLSDNYAYLLECERSKKAAIVDASEAEPVLSALAGRKIEAIYATHHHHDHVGGNEAVAKATGVTEIVGHASDKGRIPAQSRFVEEGDSLSLGELSIRILHIPGHTLGAVAYVVTDPSGETAVFTGDTLFLAGCGRLFEGTPAMMHASLSKLVTLPASTLVYCGHEYTASNLKFAAHVEPDNADVQAQIAALTGRTVPGAMAVELRTNPFLRVRSPSIRKTLNIPADADDGVALGIVRSAKDSFR
jgi:hydroxyacylglutathione hydrolase